MSDESTGDAPTETAETSRRPFRKAFTRERMPVERAERQGRITTLAWQLLGGRDAAMAFLNHHDETLGGRPLDLAVASAEGCAAVEQAIHARAKRS